MVSYKTVIVLDHGPEMVESSKQNIDFDLFNKSRGPGIIPLAPVTKSLWTCNVEAAVEYCRILFDLFPNNKLIRFVSSDSSANVLNSWNAEEQNVQQLLTSLGTIGPPNYKEDPDECSIIHGLSLAIELLCEPTVVQHQLRTNMNEDTDVTNKGRIICMTSLKSEQHLKTLQECIYDAIVQHNRLAHGSDSQIPIDHCEIDFVHVVPVGSASSIKPTTFKKLSSLVSCEVHVTESGRDTPLKLVTMAQAHHDLFSTTVTGIPMKEEQNAGSSANYDVELLHSKNVHSEALQLGNTEGLLVQSKEGLPTHSLTLKWCTPKSNVMEIQNCIGAYRITPVDVNSRPSACLTNFLLSGRAVMLEQPRKGGSRLISHMLASHGGEILIHMIHTSRTVLEDPPSISEGCGGRVTDYRITDFGEFMKDNRLAPAPQKNDIVSQPAELCLAQLERMTRVWPLAIGETLIFNMLSHLDPLPTLLVKEKLDEDDVLDCKKAIYHVVGMESRNEPLPVPSVSARSKGSKRDEQYRQMWTELEGLVRAHMSNSPQHKQIFDCLLECRKQPGDGARPADKTRDEKPTDTELEVASRDLERFQKLTEREKQDMNKMESRSRSSSPLAKKPRTVSVTDAISMKTSSSSAPQSLYSLWTNRLQAIHAMRHCEFAGRLESKGNKAELYQHLNQQNGEPTTTKVEGKAK